MSLFSRLFKYKNEEPPIPEYENSHNRGKARRLYNRGEIVIIKSVDNRLAKLGFKVGQEYPIWIDYEDLIYLESPIKSETTQDYFYPDQIKLK